MTGKSTILLGDVQKADLEKDISMHFEWFRWFVGTVDDKKFTVVAKIANVPRVIVLGVWQTIIEHAAAHDDRGSLNGYDFDDNAACLEIEPVEVERVFRAMEERGLIVDQRLKNWEKRQPKKEDGTATERKREQRERDKLRALNYELAERLFRIETTLSQNATPCHAMSQEEENKSVVKQAPGVPEETGDVPPGVSADDTPVPSLPPTVPGDDTPEKHGDRIPYQRIINALNEKLRTKYRVTDDTRRLIKARWRDGFREDDFLKVVEVMQAKWGHDPKMSQYLRPVTLFGTKMDGYLNQKLFLSDQGIISENLEKNLGVFERFAASVKAKREAGDAEREGIQPGHGDVV